MLNTAIVSPANAARVVREIAELDPEATDVLARYIGFRVDHAESVAEEQMWTALAEDLGFITPEAR